MRIAVSWSLHLTSEESSASFSSSSWETELLLNTTLRALSCTLSNLRLSETLQKCQIVLQVKWGNMAALYSCNLVWVGIGFVRRLKTTICWVAFMQTELMCSLKLSSESRCTPNNLSDFSCSMLTPSICKFIVFASVLEPSNLDWYFWTFTCSRLSLYHLVILLPSLRSLP